MENPRLDKKDKAVLGSIGLLQLGLMALKIGGWIHWHWTVILLPIELVYWDVYHDICNCDISAYFRR